MFGEVLKSQIVDRHDGRGRGSQGEVAVGREKHIGLKAFERPGQRPFKPEIPQQGVSGWRGQCQRSHIGAKDELRAVGAVKAKQEFVFGMLLH